LSQQRKIVFYQQL